VSADVCMHTIANLVLLLEALSERERARVRGRGKEGGEREREREIGIGAFYILYLYNSLHHCQSGSRVLLVCSDPLQCSTKSE